MERRFRDTDERLRALEEVTKALAEDSHQIREDVAAQREDVHKIQTRVEEVATAWLERDAEHAQMKARHQLMWAGYVALVAAAIVTATTWFVRRELAAMDAAALQVRAAEIEIAISKVPEGEVYRTETGQPRVRAVQALVPDHVRGITDDEVTAACIRVPRACDLSP